MRGKEQTSREVREGDEVDIIGKQEGRVAKERESAWGGSRVEEENEWEQYIMTYAYEDAMIKLITQYLNLQSFF